MHTNIPRNDQTRNTKNVPLGTNAVFAVSGKENEQEASPDEKRRESMKLRFALQDTAKYLLKNIPVGKRLLACMVVPVFIPGKDTPHDVNSDAVIVERDTRTNKTRYGNLAHCDSPWTCPVCSQRQTEADKSEINKAYLAARAKGYIAVMVTYTQRHDRADELKFLLDVNQQARRWMKSNSRLDGTTWGDLKGRYGLIGGIINLECTHGKNAWHPHNHELVFINPAIAESDDLDMLRWEMARRWKNAVQRFGGDCDTLHGLHIRVGDDAVSEYISKFGQEPHGKWSLEYEMTKGSQKTGRKDGRTPFQLLYDFRFEGDRQAGCLFVEFAQEFAGRAHIRWSQGLRELLEIDTFEIPLTDEDRARKEDEKPEFEPYLAIPGDAWRKIVLAKYGRRAEFLIACELGEIEVTELLIRWEYFGLIHWLYKNKQQTD